MEELIAPGIYIYDEFMIEDGDGLNLILLDEERITLESKFYELLKDLMPVEVKDNTDLYKISDLDIIFEKAKEMTNYRKKL